MSTRREFITLLGGAAAAWPLAARGQQPERFRRVGVLMSVAANDPEGQARIVAFLQGLQQLGLNDGRNVRIETRWTTGNAEDAGKYAAELVALAPDVILGAGSFTVGPLLQATHSVPIVFVHVPDPVAAGFVDSLARPGGNATGFTQFEYSTSGKWLELLKEIMPSVTRAAVVRDPAITGGIGQFSAIQAVARSLGVEVSPVNVRDVGEIERVISAFARGANSGLIVTGSALAQVHRKPIITLAARYKLPAVYFERFFVTALLLVSTAHAVNATLFDKLNYNFIRDIAPVAGIVRVPNIMEVNPSVPAKTLPEFIAYAKANPGKLSMASAGNGTIPHMAGELFKMMAGVNMVHVPYRGGAPALTDLLGGQVQVLFHDMSSIDHIRAGRLRALAVTSATRLEALPDIPTVGEFVPNYEANAWFGIGAPNGTPAEIIDRLNKQINASFADPKTKARLADLGTALSGSPTDFGKLIADETEKWGKVIRAANIKPD